MTYQNQADKKRYSRGMGSKFVVFGPMGEVYSFAHSFAQDAWNDVTACKGEAWFNGMRKMIFSDPTGSPTV